MLCLRLDLDYVPWDSERAEQFGHGEPAMILKLLALARKSGLKYHFFASVRTMRAFPTLANAVLGEAHDLDWLSNKQGDEKEFAEANELFALAGHKMVGIAYSGIGSDLAMTHLKELKFISAETGSHVGALRFFPISGRLDEEAIRSLADDEEAQTFVASPQILAKVDQSLARFEKFAIEHSRSLRTLRDALIQPIKIRESGAE